MARQVIGAEFEVKTGKAQKEIAKVTNSLKDFNEELERNRDGVEIIDAVTGGAASTYLDFKDKVKGGITAVKGLSKSFKGLKTAILASGVGAIVVALGLVVAYWDDIKELVSGVSREQKDLLALQEEQAELAQQQLDAISQTENILKLQGKSDREILELKKAQTDETIAALEAQLETQKQIKQSQVETATRNRNIVAGFVTLVSAPLVALLALVDGISEGLASLGIIEEGTNLAEGFVMGTAELLFNPDDVAEEGQKTIDETEKQLTKLKNQRAGYQLSLNKQDADAAEKRRKQQEDENAKLLEQQQKAYQKELDALQDRLNKELQMRLTGTQKVADIRRSFFEKNLEENEANELFLLEQERAKQLKEIEESGALAAAKRMAEAEVNKFYDQQAADTKKKYDDEETAREEALKEQKLSMLGDTFGQVANILGKNSAAGKAAAIAAATINTYQGVSEVFATESTLPEPFATIQRIVSAATVLASGLKTVRQIKSTPKPAGVPSSGGSGGGGGGISLQAPAFNLVGSTGTNQIADAIAESTKKPQRAYVVSGDVSTAQELERKTVQGASLG